MGELQQTKRMRKTVASIVVLTNHQVLSTIPSPSCTLDSFAVTLGSTQEGLFLCVSMCPCVQLCSLYVSTWSL